MTSWSVCVCVYAHGTIPIGTVTSIRPTLYGPTIPTGSYSWVEQCFLYFVAGVELLNSFFLWLSDKLVEKENLVGSNLPRFNRKNDCLINVCVYAHGTILTGTVTGIRAALHGTTIPIGSHELSSVFSILYLSRFVSLAASLLVPVGLKPWKQNSNKFPGVFSTYFHTFHTVRVCRTTTKTKRDVVKVQQIWRTWWQAPSLAYEMLSALLHILRS